MTKTLEKLVLNLRMRGKLGPVNVEPTERNQGAYMYKIFSLTLPVVLILQA